MNKKDLRGAPERRSLSAPFEVRAASDSELTLTGYASVFDAPYEIMGGPPWGWTEIVDVKAFDETLKASPDVHLLINHEGMPLARTRSKTLDLSTDSHGLKVSASLDRSDPDVQRLEVKMKRGDMNEMSFAFRTIRDLWNDEETERRLLEVSIDKGDVSVVNFGANPATNSEIQRALQALASADESQLAEVRKAGVDLGAVQRTISRVLEGGAQRALDPEDVNMLTQSMAWLYAIHTITHESLGVVSTYLGVPNPDMGEMPDPAMPPADMPKNSKHSRAKKPFLSVTEAAQIAGSLS